MYIYIYIYMNNNNNIVLVIVIFVLIYCLYKINKLENKENFDTATTKQQINTAVKKIYLADVEAIRILSNFAIQLSQGGMTIPGNMTVSGSVNSTSLTSGSLTTNLVTSKNLKLTDPTGHSLEILSSNNINSWIINNYPDPGYNDRLMFRFFNAGGWSIPMFEFYKSGTLVCNAIQCNNIKCKKIDVIP